MLLSVAWFPPISYFALMAKDFILSPDRVKPSVVYLEACEHYQKQSWRNRFRYYAADGPQSLNFPIIHESGTHELPITEIRLLDSLADPYRTGDCVRLRVLRLF